ncbi:MAG: histidine phosphatase family protein [Chlamydiae bacterium]|nr:histidine phosphatase family protein [Chlamydiota bacterium]
MEIYLCRHGETAWTLTGQHTGLSDIALTEKGKRQGLLLSKRLEGVGFDAVYTSPLKRAFESCQIPGVRPVLDPDLVEWNYGDFEGKTHAQIVKVRPEWHLFNEGGPHGESLKDVGMRADRFLKKVGSVQGKIAVFSHGHFSRVLAARWLGLEVGFGRCFVLGVASLSILGFEREQRVILKWNDVGHLERM